MGVIAMDEQWKTVNGYEGIYEVSNAGRVRSLPRKMATTYRGKPIIRTNYGRMLKPSLDSHGYLQARLSRDGRDEFPLIHRLVAKAFIENPEDKPQVNHKDGDTTNNAAGNLEWATNYENQHYSIRVLKRDRRQARLTSDGVKEIRRRHAIGESMSALAADFKVSKGTIWRVIAGKLWKHVA